jgi:hypothetical protein
MKLIQIAAVAGNGVYFPVLIPGTSVKSSYACVENLWK